MLKEQIAYYALRRELKEKLEAIPDSLIELPNGTVDVEPIIAVVKQVFGEGIGKKLTVSGRGDKKPSVEVT